MRRVVFIFVIFSAVSVCPGAVITVDDDGPADFNNIQAAINDANDGDIVEVQPGIYTGNGNRDIDFKGKAITVRGATGDANDCVIDCQADSNNPHRGFKFVSGEDSNSVVEAFTIKNGYGPEEDVSGTGNLKSAGGAIYCKESQPTISSCILRDNFAKQGGAVCNSHSRTKIDNCILTDNLAYWGGGIYNSYDSDATVNRCIISENVASLTGAATPPPSGGGIYNAFYSSSIISDCTIINNSAGYQGGGIANLYYSHSDMTDCIISNNTAAHYGGGIHNYSHCEPIIARCTISNNSADYGGGISNDNSEPDISNCIINDNTSIRGGGIYNDSSNPSIINSTISGNSAEDGGGMANIGNSYPTVTHCIFWGNLAVSDEDEIFNGAFVISYSDIAGCGGSGAGWDISLGTDGGGNIDADPCFIDDYHISSDSPCFDAGDPCYIPDINGTDIDGDPRVIVRIDMGADEIYCGMSPLIVVKPGTLNYEAQGLSSGEQSQQISVSNYGAGVLNWQISEPNDCDWLAVFPMSGQVDTGESNDVEITVNPDVASYGTQCYQLQVVAPDAENSPQVVTVNLQVLGPVMKVEPTNLDISAARDAIVQEPFEIRNTGYDIIHWSIETPNDCNWLSVEPLSGECAHNEGDTVIVTVDANGLDNGEYFTELFIHSLECSSKSVTLRLFVYTPNEIYVPQDYPTIQEAIDSSIYGDIIKVATGTYFENITLKNGVALIGQDPSNTIIDGNNIDSVVYSQDCDKYTILEGFTITNGYAATCAGLGGGMYNCGSNLTIANCVFSFNLARYGGGMYNSRGSSPMITNCTFSDNSADASGGGIFNISVSPTITKCTFNGNTAVSRGGGICCVYNVNLKVEDCIFSGNTAVSNVGGGFDGDGGGMYSIGGNSTVINCDFIDNTASNNGGGLYCEESELEVTDCVFRGNTAFGGGGMSNSESNSIVTNCTFSGNKAFLATYGSGHGGGMYNTGSNLTVTNCAFVGNLAIGEWGLGGGMDNSGSNLMVTNCTFNGNWAHYFGGGMLNFGGDYITVTNCVLWANTATLYPQIYDSDFLIISYSDIEGGWEGEGNIDADPCFADPGYWDPNGTPADANDDFWVGGDFHLQSQAGRWDANSQSWVTDSNISECIDAGDPNSDWTAELWPHGKRINMGAYGGTPQASMSLSDVGSIADLDNDGDVDYNDLKLFTGKWSVEQVLLAEDFDRNGKVDFKDYAIFANEWFNEGLPEPTITYEIIQCGGGPLATVLEETRFTVTVEGKYIHFEDVMVANCCATELWLEMYVEGEQIIIFEKEYGGFCLCICDNPVEAELGPFKPGTYTLEVYEDWGGFIGSTIVVIE